MEINDSKKERRYNNILDSATLLLIKNPKATLEAVAENADIGIATLHRYFKNRDNLIESLGFRAINTAKETLLAVNKEGISTLEYLQLLVEALIPLGDKIYFLLFDPLFINHQKIAEGEENLKKFLISVIDDLKKEKIILEKLSSKWIVDVLYSIIITAWEYIIRDEITNKQACIMVMDTFMNGIKN